MKNGMEEEHNVDDEKEAMHLDQALELNWRWWKWSQKKKIGEVKADFVWPCENFASSCEIEKHAFSTPLCNFSYFFIFNPSSPPSIKLQSLVQVHFLFLFIHIMYPPPFHFPFVIPCFKNHLKISPKLNKEPLVSLVRIAMYYLGILGIITTQKVWKSWKLVSKMCGFHVVISWRYLFRFM